MILLWIRTGLNAYPDPAFYPNADRDPRSQNKANPDPDQTLKVTVANRSQKHTKLKTPFLRQKKGFCLSILVNFHAPESPDPDPGSVVEPEPEP